MVEEKKVIKVKFFTLYWLISTENCSADARMRHYCETLHWNNLISAIVSLISSFLIKYTVKEHTETHIYLNMYREKQPLGLVARKQQPLAVGSGGRRLIDGGVNKGLSAADPLPPDTNVHSVPCHLSLSPLPPPNISIPQGETQLSGAASGGKVSLKTHH